MLEDDYSQQIEKRVTHLKEIVEIMIRSKVSFGDKVAAKGSLQQALVDHLSLSRKICKLYDEIQLRPLQIREKPSRFPSGSVEGFFAIKHSFFSKRIARNSRGKNNPKP